MARKKTETPAPDTPETITPESPEKETEKVTEQTTAQTPPQKSESGSNSPVLGAVVLFIGGGVFCTPKSENKALQIDGESVCRITAVEKGTKHPYHAISKDEGGVYGWIDANSIKNI